MSTRTFRRSAILIVLMAPALLGPMPSAAVAAGPADQRAIEEAGGDDVVNTQDSNAAAQPADQALAHDLALVAQSKGWTLEQAAADHRAAEEVGRIAERMALERPGAFVGSALAQEAGAPPTLYVKGPADNFIRDLVATSAINIVVADNQPYSFAELEARSLRVHNALVARGFRDVTTGVDITGGGVIPAGVTAAPGLPRDRGGILALLPTGLANSVQLTVHEQPHVQPEAAFGGMWVADDGRAECTSGWSVRHIDTGTNGVSTAGHCSGINQIRHPNHGTHALSHRAQHLGSWGDVEWLSSAELEPDDFYADSSTIRDVAAVEARGNISLGESVCQYGRASNQRDCSLDVADLSEACTDSRTGVTVSRLVVMNGDTAIGGDSGGGWSFGNTAFGGHYGNCGSRDSWTPAAQFDEALGVRVTCGC